MTKHLTPIVGALALSGCTLLDPPESRERAELPELREAFAPADGLELDAPPTLDWWNDFGDAQLSALIQEALAANFDLRAAAERVAQAESQSVIAGADRYPQVNAGLLAQRQRQVLLGIPLGGDGPVAPTFSTYGLSLDLSWELDLWGRLAATERAAELEFGAAQVDFAGAQLSVAGQVTKAWLAAVEAELQLGVAIDGVETRERSLSLVEDRFRAGLAPRFEVEQARSELASARAAVDDRTRALEATVRQVELLLGRYPGADLELSPALPQVPKRIPGGLPSDLLARRPDVVAAELRLRAADERLTAANADRYPRLSLTASGGTATDDLENLLDGDFRVWSIAGNLVQPIFDAGRIRANVERTDAQAAEIAAGFANTVLVAASEVEIALDAEEDLARRVTNLEEALEAAQAAEEQVDQRYRAGLENLLQVLAATRTRLNVESAALDARRIWLENRVDLYLALGGGFDFTETDDGEALEDQELGAEQERVQP